MLWAVAAASPATTTMAGTMLMAKAPRTILIRYSAPAILASWRGAVPAMESINDLPQPVLVTSIYFAASAQVEGLSGQYFAIGKPTESNKSSYDTSLLAAGGRSAPTWSARPPALETDPIISCGNRLRRSGPTQTRGRARGSLAAPPNAVLGHPDVDHRTR